jgi:cold shock CspA family protein
MAKAMLFIDGTWLYANTGRLKDVYGRSEFHVDYSKLPRTLAGEVSRQSGSTEVDVVRTHLFGSYPADYDPRDEELAGRRRDFFEMLREEYHYEVETYPINFRGRRIRRADRDPGDTFEPKEKCVDISLATSMMFYAAVPNAYDIAIAVLGDRDFMPVLQHVRRLGKRVAIASIRGSCAPDLCDTRDDARVRDFDVIWLDNLLNALELKYEPHQLSCESPVHKGDRRVWTTFHPRKGQKFFCDACRAEFARQNGEEPRTQALEADGGRNGTPPEPLPEPVVLQGRVAKIVADRGYGFIRAEDGQDYFFHLTDLQAGLAFDRLEDGMPLEFGVKRTPAAGRAGAARNVRGWVEAETVEETGNSI